MTTNKVLGLHISFCIDVSGSMAGNGRLSDAKKSLCSTLKTIRDEIFIKNSKDETPRCVIDICIWSFNSNSKKIYTITGLRKDDPENAESSINALVASGGTAIFGCIDAAIKEKRKDREHHIILLSDGETSDSPTTTNYEGSKIHVIAIDAGAALEKVSKQLKATTFKESSDIVSNFIRLCQTGLDNVGKKESKDCFDKSAEVAELLKFKNDFSNFHPDNFGSSTYSTTDLSPSSKASSSTNLTTGPSSSGADSSTSSTTKSTTPSSSGGVSTTKSTTPSSSGGVASTNSTTPSSGAGSSTSSTTKSITGPSSSGEGSSTSSTVPSSSGGGSKSITGPSSSGGSSSTSSTVPSSSRGSSSTSSTVPSSSGGGSSISSTVPSSSGGGSSTNSTTGPSSSGAGSSTSSTTKSTTGPSSPGASSSTSSTVDIATQLDHIKITSDTYAQTQKIYFQEREKQLKLQLQFHMSKKLRKDIMDLIYEARYLQNNNKFPLKLFEKTIDSRLKHVRAMFEYFWKNNFGFQEKHTQTMEQFWIQLKRLRELRTDSRFEERDFEKIPDQILYCSKLATISLHSTEYEKTFPKILESALKHQSVVNLEITDSVKEPPTIDMLKRIITNNKIKRLTLARAGPLYNIDLINVGVESLHLPCNRIFDSADNIFIDKIPHINLNYQYLIELNLSGNLIPNEKSLVRIPNLKKLLLCDCNLCDMKTLQNLPELEELHMRYNDFSKLSGLWNELLKFPKLKVIDLSGNDFSKISQFELPACLESLNISDCGIRSMDVFDFSKLNLKTLNLGWNNLNILPNSFLIFLEHTKSLHTLKLTGNPLKQETLKLLRYTSGSKLKYLDLAFTSIPYSEPIVNDIKLKISSSLPSLTLDGAFINTNEQLTCIQVVLNLYMEQMSFFLRNSKCRTIKCTVVIENRYIDKIYVASTVNELSLHIEREFFEEGAEIILYKYKMMKGIMRGEEITNIDYLEDDDEIYPVRDKKSVE